MLKSKKEEEEEETLGEGCEIKVLNVNIQHLFDHLHLITFFNYFFTIFTIFAFFKRGVAPRGRGTCEYTLKCT